MDNYLPNWPNRNESQSWIDQAFLPYDYVVQNVEKELSNKKLDTALNGQDHEINDDEADYMFRELKTFSIVQLVNKIRDIHNMTYELGVNESLEMARAKILDIFDSS
ncbi:unnamed protein product [Adineta ricciae]|uniref:Uncharacterized protein n=1 Tax=Adineta ricciae TaxID=249248 RepID=A0A813WLD9_ADIRI|nr:unnamed protein product [Adineta ricciae]